MNNVIEVWQVAHRVAGSYGTPPTFELEVMGTIFLSKAEVFSHKISLQKKYKIRGPRRGHHSGVANFFDATLRFY